MTDPTAAAPLPAPAHAALLVAAVTAVAFVFANVEIQIEGAAGWAAGLPVTFRIDHHWALDWFWGGRPMTGYHAWVFTFMALVFHLPFALTGRWSGRLEARALGSVMLFWILEDALWFVCNPAFGWAGLRPGAPGEPCCAWWHIHWFLGVPADYWTFSVVGGVLLWWSFRGAKGRGEKRVASGEKRGASGE